eukprot:scaffold192805_cov14-Tisochrysis_lutea.AAC.1
MLPAELFLKGSAKALLGRALPPWRKAAQIFLLHRTCGSLRTKQKEPSLYISSLVVSLAGKGSLLVALSTKRTRKTRLMGIRR